MKQINLYKFCTNDPYRIALNGVYHDGEAQTAISCDSTILVASTSHYDPEKAGQIIDKTGAQILSDPDKNGERKQPVYPKWRSIIPDPKKGDKFPLNDLIKACQNAANFLKNVPTHETLEGGCKGRKIERNLSLVVRVEKLGEEPYIVGFKYEMIKRLLMLPQEGAKAYSYGNRRALYWINEAEGYRAILMPVMIDKEAAEKAVVDGIYTFIPASVTDGTYAGPSYISCDRYGSAERLFRTPEKKERVPMVKCLGEGYGSKSASVHLRPEADVVPIEGTKTFYKRDVVDAWGNPEHPDLYKKDSGFFVY